MTLSLFGFVFGQDGRAFDGASAEQHQLPHLPSMMRRGLPQWDELTRSELQILIKLFGGGTLRTNDPIETAELRSDDLIDDNGLTPAGMEFVKAALKQRWPASARC